MTWGSLVGFAVVFVLVCTTSSALLAAALRASRTTLARRGPAVQRLAAELVAAVPALLGFAVVAILTIASLLGPDHCGVHEHHAHLCLRHGAVWLERPWAVATLAVAAAVLLARAANLVAGFARGARAVGRLRQLAREQHGDVRLIASERVFCFVAGVWRPAVFVSTAARDALDAEEWAAMLAHEQSHVRHHDLARRCGLELALLVAAPIVALEVRDAWEQATEQLRDAEAAVATASPESVASALVRMARLATTHRSGLIAAFTSRADRSLAARIEALLDGRASGDASAGALARRIVLSFGIVLAAVTVFAAPLHHALETLLG